MENDLGRQDAEIYFTSLCQVDHASETGRSVLAYCREETDWEVAKKAVFKLSSAARRLRQPRKVQFCGTPDGIKPNRTLRIQNEYSFLQGSYSERKKETVDKILNGTVMNAPEEDIRPKLEEVQQMYVYKMEERTRHDTTPISPTDEVFSLESYGRITTSEVKEALRASKKGSAAGPDGLLLRDVKKVSPFLLCNIFNKWYLHGIPIVENRCRTTLLYKSGDRHLASN